MIGRLIEQDEPGCCGERERQGSPLAFTADAVSGVAAGSSRSDAGIRSGAASSRQRSRSS